MRVATGDPARWDLPAVPRAVTIGVFDGVHLGHRHVFSLLAERAAAHDLEATVMTFDPHPLTVIAPEVAPRLLTSIDQRIELFGSVGVRCVAVLPFDQAMRSISPAGFAGEIVAEALGARLVAVGEDFRFGRNRTGNVESLTEFGAGFGFSTEIVPLVGGDEPISSTRIRGLIAAGDVVGAAELLDRSHELRGRVVRGDGRGASIGIPTANLDIPAGMAVPERGVYAVRSGTVGDADLPGVANIGVRPTFGGERETLEVHLLEGGRDLYGEELAVRFVDRIRDERRFSGVEELVAQIRRDIEAARALL
ncbi:MAG TPA: bifunctional riboflavin kinase/FAD synthetase [Acidimicrobiia bacterium]|nr:bifunctional riboflavin kinase/FAD synthetase [Acidimicrobiia bacterium]